MPVSWHSGTRVALGDRGVLEQLLEHRTSPLGTLLRRSGPERRESIGAQRVGNAGDGVSDRLGYL